jgi:hypothetical protein
MAKRLARFATALAAFGLLFAPTGSAAAAEIGDRCIANDTESDWTAIVLNNGIENGLQQPFVLAPPEGQSVITRWRSELGAGTGPIQQQLLAFQQVGEESDRLVGASAVETLVDGVNEFPTRIPIPEYGHIGLRGPVETLFCDKESGHLMGVVEGAWPTGETRDFNVALGNGVPAIAFLEPDRDRDGFGDETQDGCVLLAWTQGPCPTVRISVRRKKVTRRAIVVRVSFESNLPLPAAGRVEVSADRSPRSRTIAMAPGSASLVRLPIGKGVRRHLARLSPTKGLRTTVE